MTDRVRYGLFATILGVTGVALSLLGYLAVRNPAAARLVGSPDGIASLVTGLAFTAVACAVVLHYGRRSAQLANAYLELHRATLQRERSEAALRESERFTRATLDAMDAHIAVLDADGVVMAVNRAWRARPHPLLSDGGACDVGSNYLAQCGSVTDARAAEAARVAAAIRAITSGERDDCVLESHVAADGRVIVTRVTRFAGNGPLRLVVAHQDVTTLPRASQEPAPARADPTAEGAPVALFRADAIGGLTWANAHLLAWANMDLDAATGIGWLRMVHPDDRASAVAQWQQIVDSRAAGEATFRVVGGDGAIHACCLRATAVESGFAGTLLDVTQPEPPADVPDLHAAVDDLQRRVEDLTRERERAGAALRAAEAERTRTAEELARLYDEAPCGYSALDADGTIVAMNETACGWLGYRRSKLVGERRFADLLATASAARFADALGRLAAGDDEVRELELDVARKDGSFVALAARLSAVRDVDGQSAGARATLIDVTERRQAAERTAMLHQALADRTAALEQVNRRVEETDARLAQTTRELDETRRRLDETVRRLGDATRELDAFSRSVSHELEVPLRALDGVARTLTEEHASQLDAGGRRHLGIIRESASGMTQLLDGLVSLSRLGRRPLERVRVDMTALARDVVEEVRRRHPARDVPVSVDGLAPARGEPTLLRQLLAHLVDNAFKATAAVAHPYVDLGSVAGEGGPVYYVRDNGAGFDQRRAQALFDGDHTDGSDDAGIGLAVVRRVVEQHGGRIWAEGRPDDGATFFFTLADDAGDATTASAPSPA